MYTIFHKNDPPHAVSSVYFVETKEAAFEEFAKDQGYDSFASYCESKGVSKQDFEIFSAETGSKLSLE